MYYMKFMFSCALFGLLHFIASPYTHTHTHRALLLVPFILVVYRVIFFFSLRTCFFFQSIFTFLLFSLFAKFPTATLPKQSQYFNNVKIVFFSLFFLRR